MPFDAMQRIMKANLLEDLEEEVEKNGSYLQKVAFRLSRKDDSSQLGDALQAAMFVSEKDPNRGKMLLDLLEQYSTQALQNALNKITTEAGDQSGIEAARINRMADLLRARIDLGRDQMTLMKVQKEVAQEMGLSGQNPAMGATGQMPLPLAGGAPPMPMGPQQGGPPQMPMGPQPGAAPMPMPMPPQGGGQQQQGGQVPGSPMEAAAL